MAYLKTIKGIRVPRFFPDDAVLSAIAHKPRPGDIYITPYPKCGTTWVQYIAYGIFHDGYPPSDMVQFFKESPFLEAFGVDSLDAMPRLGTIKTHLPIDDQRFSSSAKYIYVARNPYDVCVSRYCQTRTYAISVEDVGEFGDYLESIVAGRVTYGDYLEDSLLPWYSRRNEKNVLFLVYENLHANIELHVKRIAEFLGDDYGHRVRRDPAMLQRLVIMSSKERMRPLFREYMKDTVKFMVQQRAAKEAPISPELSNLLELLSDCEGPRHEFVRDAGVGGLQSIPL
ncbi:hypothetical protein MTO96_000958 [Rhipicephalus appendiculatus]